PRSGAAAGARPARRATGFSGPDRSVLRGRSSTPYPPKTRPRRRSWTPPAGLADLPCMSAHAAPASTITLPQILALGSQSRPWAFVPIARQALPQTASDPELWFLLAANLADLGLGTLAREELDALCERRPQALRLPHV